MFPKGSLIEIMSYKGLTYDSQFKSRWGLGTVLKSFLNSNGKEIITVQLFTHPDLPKRFRNFIVEELEYE